MMEGRERPFPYAMVLCSVCLMVVGAVGLPHSPGPGGFALGFGLSSSIMGVMVWVSPMNAKRE